MKKPIKTFADLHAAVAGRPENTIYRGVQRAGYKLIPKVGRIKRYTTRLERDILVLFKLHSRPYLESEPTNEAEWLAIAQHHGLPTRLLDWTRNPLVAAYFALEKRSGEDPAIYVLNARMVLDPEDPIQNPFKVWGPGVLYPPHITPRIAAQAGVFTVQPRPQAPLNNRVKGIERLVIDKASREKLLTELYRYGVHRGTLFPDLDGQAGFIRWLKSGSYE